MKSNTAPERRPVTFVLCAAGKGERFVTHGLTTPKPLLNLAGKKMIERSIESLDLTHIDQLIIISQKEHQLKEKLGERIQADWIEITVQTKGQLETFLYAKDIIKNDDVVIYNCDTYFHSRTLRQIIEVGNYDGIIPCSQEPGESWSFCKVDEKDNILHVTEKKRISEWASVGYYYFKDKNLLLTLSQEQVTREEGEVYVAPLYEKYIERGKLLKMVRVDSFKPFGTVEQVKEYWGISLEELYFQNN